MQATLDQSNSASDTTQNHWVSLGQNHGYRFEGDTAILNAELAIAPRAQQQPERAEQWALQLWACDAPHQGGPLQGIKVAEAALALPSERELDYLETAAFAQLPPAQRAYSMVLVLASGTLGAYDQVHDFSNYPARQEFAAPHFDGSVGYRFEGDAVVLQAEGVENPRDVDNLSGSLSLELWALRAPYAGGAFEGVLLGSSELDRLEGQSEARGIEHRVPLTQAPVGEWRLALMLREWTEAAGYLTRDFCNFENPYRVESTFGDERRSEPSPFFAHSQGVDEELRSEPSHDDAPRQTFGAPTDVVIEQPVIVLSEATLAETAEVAPPAVTPSEPVAAASPAATVPEPAEAAAPAAIVAEPAEAAAPAAIVAEPAEAAAPAAIVPELAVAVAKTASAPEPATKEIRTERAPTPRTVVSAVTAAPSEPTSKVSKPVPQARTPVAAAARMSPSSAAEPALSAASPQSELLGATEARVSVQTSSVDDLAAVPGLNKKLAAAIVRARPFVSLDDLRRVRGIGDKMLQQLRSTLTL